MDQPEPNYPTELNAANEVDDPRDFPPLHTLPPKLRNFVLGVGHYVKALVVLTFWTVAVAATLGSGYVGLRAVFWAVNHVCQALGLET